MPVRPALLPALLPLLMGAGATLARPSPVQAPGRAPQPPEASQKGRGRGEIKPARGTRKLYHFGKVREGERLQHAFRLTTTRGEVVIHAVTSNCGCTVGRVNVVDGDEVRPYELGTPLAPGSEIEVEGLIDTFGRHGDFTTTLAVRSNASERVLILNLRADVRAGLLVEPERVDVTALLDGPQVLSIRENGIGPFRLEVTGTYEDRQPVEDGGPLEVALSPVEPDAEGRSGLWEARVGLRADRLVGAQSFEVKVQSDVPTPFQPEPGAETEPGTEAPGEGPRCYLTWFGVEGKLERGVTIHPALVSFGKVEGEGELEREVTIRSRDGRPLPTEPALSLESLRPEGLAPESFSWDVLAADGQEIDLLLRAELPAEFHGTFEGVLAVRLDHPTLQVARVRFTGARP